MIDLVRDQADAAVTAKAGEPRQIGGGDHRAGRIGRAGDDQAVERPRFGEEFGVRLIVGVFADLDQHRLDPECCEDVAVGGIARGGERHPVARLERGEKSQLEGGRRTGRDDDLAGIDGDTVLRAVMSGDRLRATVRCRARRCSRSVRCARACRAASRTASGAWVPGWPTSRWITSAPAASRSLAARSTSMAMKGGTSPRRDARKLIRASASTRASPNRV